jgi:hypothetical protein
VLHGNPPSGYVHLYCVQRMMQLVYQKRIAAA